MIVDFVSDTGPLISFEKIPNGFATLRRLARRVFVPLGVKEELSFGVGEEYFTHHGIGDFVVVTSTLQCLIETGELHLGEQQAIALAAQMGLPLLIEERYGRTVAKGLGITVSGPVGLILAGCDQGSLTTEEGRMMVAALFAARRIPRSLLDSANAQLRGH